jgi:hypothetical protein
LYWLAAVSGSGTARTQSVYSAPVSDLATYRTEKTFDNAALTAFGATLGELAWSAARGRWLIGPGASGAAAGLWEFDDAWTLIQSLLPAAAVGSGYGAGLSAYPTDPDGIAAGTGIWDITSQTAMTLSTGSPGYRCYPIGEQLTLLVPASGTGGYLAAQSTFFSRAVLDAPVTKTATNTMKISYEFTTDQPALW